LFVNCCSLVVFSCVVARSIEQSSTTNMNMELTRTEDILHKHLPSQEYKQIMNVLYGGILECVVCNQLWLSCAYV
jgi:hypothetical protein